MNKIEINELHFSKRKTISIIIDANGRLIVRAPYRTPQKVINDVVLQKQNWIIRKREEILNHKNEVKTVTFKEGDKVLYRGINCSLKYENNLKPPILLKNGSIIIDSQYVKYAPQLLEKWYKIEAFNYFNRKARHYANLMKVHFKRVKISNAQKRWGSCSSQKNINLSWRLIMAPDSVIDYVIVHELAHLIEMNHSQKFWAIVERQMPSFRKHKNWLDKNGHLLTTT
jgi:predicted metal-dependent hydrolase